MESVFEKLGEGEKRVNLHKRRCKMIKKFYNIQNLTLMQIQHQYAKDLGYKNWNELLEKEGS